MILIPANLRVSLNVSIMNTSTLCLVQNSHTTYDVSKNALVPFPNCASERKIYISPAPLFHAIRYLRILAWIKLLWQTILWFSSFYQIWVTVTHRHTYCEWYTQHQKDCYSLASTKSAIISRCSRSLNPSVEHRIVYCTPKIATDILVESSRKFSLTWQFLDKQTTVACRKFMIAVPHEMVRSLFTWPGFFRTIFTIDVVLSIWDRRRWRQNPSTKTVAQRPMPLERSREESHQPIRPQYMWNSFTIPEHSQSDWRAFRRLKFALILKNCQRKLPLPSAIWSCSQHALCFSKPCDTLTNQSIDRPYVYTFLNCRIPHENFSRGRKLTPADVSCFLQFTRTGPSCIRSTTKFLESLITANEFH